MRKFLIIMILAVIAVIALKYFGYTSLLFVAPAFAAVLYGANGSIYVETPYVEQEGDEDVSFYWASKHGTPYINRDGKTYEMTRKGWRYNWAERR